MVLIILYPIILHCIILNGKDICDKMYIAESHLQTNKYLNLLNFPLIRDEYQKHSKFPKRDQNEYSTETQGINKLYLRPISSYENNILNSNPLQLQIPKSIMVFNENKKLIPISVQQNKIDNLNVVDYYESHSANLGEHKKVNPKEPTIKQKYSRVEEIIDTFDIALHKNLHLIPHECGQSPAVNRITGGQNAELGQYPWMARIGFINKQQDTPIFRCGASLITKDHVITAAHCTSDLPPELSVEIVRFGEYNTEKEIDCIELRCADKILDIKPLLITVHEGFNNPQGRNDIAMIKLRSSIVFTPWISPICLPFGDLENKDYTNETGEVAGWGFYDINVNKGSIILQRVQLPILNMKPCTHSFYGVTVNSSSQLCVGGDLGKDSCNGDSGGPLMKVQTINKDAKYVLLGVVSLGSKYCGLATFPALYTKISYYLKWILDHLKP